MNELKIGQMLWVVYNNRSPGPGYMQVSKVGRKWADLVTLGSSYVSARVNVDTLELGGRSGYTPPGRCYLSKEAREAEVELETAWSSFQSRLCHIRPKGITLDRIKELSTELLGSSS